MNEEGERLHHNKTFCNLQGTEVHQLSVYWTKFHLETRFLALRQSMERKRKQAVGSGVVVK